MQEPASAAQPPQGETACLSACLLPAYLPACLCCSACPATALGLNAAARLLLSRACRTLDCSRAACLPHPRRTSLRCTTPCWTCASLPSPSLLLCWETGCRMTSTYTRHDTLQVMEGCLKKTKARAALLVLVRHVPGQSSAQTAAAHMHVCDRQPPAHLEVPPCRHITERLPLFLLCWRCLPLPSSPATPHRY